MRAQVLFRIASVLILLFAAGHTWGFRQVDPRWNLGETLTAMKSVHFTTQGFNRTYWDFFVGFGLFVTVLLVFAAVCAWQLGGLPPAPLAQMRGLAWALTVVFGCNIVLTWRYFFAAPLIFSVLIFLLLVSGTLLSFSSR